MRLAGLRARLQHAADGLHYAGPALLLALELALPAGDTWSLRLTHSGTWSREEERYRSIKFGLDMDREVLALRLAARVFAADDTSDSVIREASSKRSLTPGPKRGSVLSIHAP